MEPPDSYDANSIRDEKLKVLKALQPIGEPLGLLRRHPLGGTGRLFVPLDDVHVVDVEDDIAIVRRETLPVNRIPSQFDDLSGNMAARHGNHFHRQGKTAEGVHPFALVGNADKFLRAGGNDFFPR